MACARYSNFHQICVNKHRHDNHIKFEVSLHFWPIWPTVRRCRCHCTIDLDWQVPINSTMHLSCHLATILYTNFFFVFMHAGKNLQSTFFLEFLSFFGENNRKLLYGSLTLLKVNLLTENPFLTCCHAHKSAKVFTKSYLNILRRIIF